jgi:hypothetical protein
MNGKSGENRAPGRDKSSQMPRFATAIRAPKSADLRGRTGRQALTMTRIAAVFSLICLFLAPSALAAGSPPPPVTDPATFRWKSRCTEIASPRIAVCRIVPDVVEGVIYHGPFIPVTFQVDNEKGRSVTVGGDQNCRELPALLRFGKNPPFELRTSDHLSGALFDRVLAEFRAAKSGTIEYAPLPDCKRVTATFYYSNLDDALARAIAFISGGAKTN